MPALHVVSANQAPRQAAAMRSLVRARPFRRSPGPLLVSLLATLLVAAVAVAPAGAKEKKSSKEDKHATAAPEKGNAHWSYEGETGPENWGEMNAKFGTCSIGKTQSPIDIKSESAQVEKLDPIKFDYQSSPLKIIDNGHTVQVNYAPGSSITVNGKRYELLQFHFHKPSEEKVNGKAYAMVAHLVHKDEAGKLAVVGVLLEIGPKQPVLQAVFDNLPKETGKETPVPGLSIDVGALLLPANRSYYTFEGSLTTPPCSEGVTWFVLKNPAQLSRKQVARFGKLYSMNARPVQPLNGRVVKTSN